MDKKIVDAGIGTGLVALGAYAKLHGAPDEVLQLIATGKPISDLLRSKLVGGFFTRVLGDRDREAFDELVRALSEVGNYDVIEAQARLAMLLSDCTKDQADRLNEAFQAMFFGRSRATWPYVARLTADRIVNHNSESDRFSRRVAWLLQRCEDDDVAVFREAADRTRRKLAETDWGTHDGVRLCVHDSERIAVYLETGRKLSITSITHIEQGERAVEDALLLIGDARIARTLGERQGVYFARDQALNRFLSLFT